MDYLRKIDAFGTPIRLTFKNEEVHQTYFGSFLTIIITAFFIVECYYFGKDVIEKKSPTTIFNEEYVNAPTAFDINPEKFPFAFGLEDGNTFQHYIDERIYKVTFIDFQRKRIKLPDGSYEEKNEVKVIPVVPCDLNTHFKLDSVKTYFSKLALPQLYCVDYSKVDRPLQLEGYFDVDLYHHIMIQFSQCKNTTESQTCLPQEDIDNKLGAGFYSIYYPDITVDPKILDEPFIHNGQNQFGFISNQFSKQHIDVNSDQGWLFEDIRLKKSLQYAHTVEMFDPRKKEVFLHMEISLQKKKDLYTRQYKKIQSVMAEVGGLLKALMVMAFIVSLPFNELNFYSSLLNEIFVFEDKEKLEKQRKELTLKKLAQQKKEARSPTNGKKRSAKMSLSEAVDQNVLRQSSINEVEIEKKDKITMKDLMSQVFNNLQKNKKFNIQDQMKDSQKAKDIQEKMQQSLEIKRGGLKFKISEYLKYYLCPFGKMKKRKQQIQQAVKQVHQRLDTVYLLNKIIELDKLKMLILNQNQLRLFDMMPQPVINLDEEDIQFQQHQQQQLQINNSAIAQELNFYSFNNYWTLINKQKSPIEKAHEAFQAFKQIQRQSSKQEIDNKVLQMMDPTLRKYFEILNSEEIEASRRDDDYGEIPLDDKERKNPILKEDVFVSIAELSTRQKQPFK